MTEPRDLRDLVGTDVPPGELEQLRRVDALLRSVPAPPSEVPGSLTHAVVAGTRVRFWTPVRRGAAVALAAALAAASFGIGTQVGGDDFDPRLSVPLRATEAARGAVGELRVGERTATGNWGIEVEVSGLRPLPRGGYYVLWLAKDGEYAATCGTFTVGPDGSADVYMNASYELDDYDAWVVTAHVPSQPEDAEAPWLLRAEI